jgi:hypothetical protein
MSKRDQLTLSLPVPQGTLKSHHVLMYHQDIKKKPIEILSFFMSSTVSGYWTRVIVDLCNQRNKSFILNCMFHTQRNTMKKIA